MHIKFFKWLNGSSSHTSFPRIKHETEEDSTQCPRIKKYQAFKQKKWWKETEVNQMVKMWWKLLTVSSAIDYWGLGKACAVSLSKRLLVCLIRLTLNTYNHQQSSSQSPAKEVTIAISFIFSRCFVLCCCTVEWNIVIPKMTSQMCVICVLKECEMIQTEKLKFSGENI